MKVTMKEVASLAGVGVGTVSRVINGVKVKDVTKKKVLSAIDELGYVPDYYARGLKTNKTNTIALILPTIWHPFFSEFAYYVEDALSKKGYKLFICNADGNPDKEKEYIQMVKQSKVDGIIGISYSDIDKYVNSNLPIVSIDRHFSETVSYVTSDNYAGGILAANELLKRGAKELAYIGGISPHPNETVKRRAGFTQALSELGYEVKILDMYEPINDLEEQLEDFFISNSDVDGIFTVNDFMALKVIDYLKRHDRKIPDEVQVIGYDGIKISDDNNFLLSTIVQPIKQMAIESVDIILKMIQNSEFQEIRVLPVYFAQGSTTKEKL